MKNTIVLITDTGNDRNPKYAAIEIIEMNNIGARTISFFPSRKAPIRMITAIPGSSPKNRTSSNPNSWLIIFVNDDTGELRDTVMIINQSSVIQITNRGSKTFHPNSIII